MQGGPSPRPRPGPTAAGMTALRVPVHLGVPRSRRPVCLQNPFVDPWSHVPLRFRGSTRTGGPKKEWSYLTVIMFGLVTVRVVPSA